MGKLYLLAAASLLAFFSGQAGAQPPPSLESWARAPATGAPIATGRNFDLAFDADQLPVLAFLDGTTQTLSLKKWTGSAWINLARVDFSGQTPQRVRMSSDGSGDIVVGLLLRAGDSSLIQVYQLRGSELRQLGPAFQLPPVTGHAVAIDARRPVVAWQASGFVTVRRWNGLVWSALGPNVNQSPNIFVEPQSPALTVTGDGKLVVAYTMAVNDALGIVAKAWTGTDWSQLGHGIPPPAAAVSLAGENSGAPVAAHNIGGTSPRVSRWTGSTWESIGQPCVPPVVGSAFGVPSLAVRGNQPLAVCGIHLSPDAVTGRRALVARTWTRLAGWEPLGQGTINGDTLLAEGNDLAYVVRIDPRGRPWVAWTAPGGGNVNIFVSTLVPAGLSPAP